MLVKFLSATDKEHLLDLVKLLAVADKPLLWNGKRKDEITSETDVTKVSTQEGEQASVMIAGLFGARTKRKEDIASEIHFDKLSIQEGEQEKELIADLESEGRQSTGRLSSLFASTSVEARLIKKITTFPLHKVEEPATREQAATMLLKELLEGKKFKFPSVPKLLLFELMLVALCGGSITNTQRVLLTEFSKHHQLEDFIFDDLLERAKSMNKEVSKTISIILE